MRRFNTERVPRPPAFDTEPNLPAIAVREFDVLTPAGPDTPRYTIVGSIHRGGMGEILLGRVEGPHGFARKVVLKGLLSKLSQDDISYQLFMREARLMARLDHPNIVRVFDLPYVGGKPYLAMEYLRGRNFHQVIQRAGAATKGVPPRIALTVVAQALRGLHYAHSAKDEDGKLLGIIHRDVSPGNLLVSFFGEVKVTDFGIAKMADSPRFTGPRSIRGKARYVAPEQVHGEPASVLSDIYSAGVVLAEALMGEPLWERPSVPETLLAIVREDRERTIDRVLSRLPNVNGLRAALRGALALNPRDRFSSALQFAETLEAIARGLRGPTDQVALGMYVRELFHDAPDLPSDDGFGKSGFPIPQFTMDEEEDTDSTVIQLEPEWIKNAATARMRPDEPYERSLPPPMPLTPMIDSAKVVEPMLPGQSFSDDADTAIQAESKRRAAPPRIRASPLPAEAAVIQDPAEPPRAYHAARGPSRDRGPRVDGHIQEYAFSEVVAAVSTDKEESAELLPTRHRRVPIPRSESFIAQRAMALLLAGIFIGASVAIAGCVVALLIGP